MNTPRTAKPIRGVSEHVELLLVVEPLANLRAVLWVPHIAALLQRRLLVIEIVVYSCTHYLSLPFSYFYAGLPTGRSVWSFNVKIMRAIFQVPPFFTSSKS